MTVRNFKNALQRNLYASLDVTQPVDLTASRPNTQGMDESIFDIEPVVAMGTAAALCSVNNDGALAARLLALLVAAQGNVTVGTDDFRELLDRAATWAGKEGSAADKELVGFVRRAAIERAFTGSVISDKPRRSEGKALVNIDDGRGYGVMGSGVENLFAVNRQFHKGQEDLEARHIRNKLLTIAAVFAVAKARLRNSGAEAVVMLSLYGAGVRIELTKSQFRTLEAQAKQYISCMRDERFAKLPNGNLASYAVRRAVARAQATGLI